MKQNGAQSHYQHDVRADLNENLLGKRLAVKFHSRSHDLTLVDLYLVGIIKNVVYNRKLATLAAHGQEIENGCATNPLDTLRTLLKQLAVLIKPLSTILSISSDSRVEW